jgi:hypothetical protein
MGRLSSREYVIFSLCCTSTLAISLQAQTQSPAAAPLPDARQLKDRVMASEKKAEKDKERYLCDVHEESDEFDSNGRLQKHRSRDMEQFFVNGQEINHVLARDGKTLTGDDEKKEQDRVNKEVKKFSDPKQVKKAEQEDEKQAEILLKALRYTNGHREYRTGRAIVVYDLSGDPDFHPKSLEEKVAQSLNGRVWVDEETGELLELRVLTDHDIKVFGFVGNLKKGFQFHLTQQRQPDGVWIPNFIEGTGNGRALFFSRGFRFKVKTDRCRLYNVDSSTGAITPKEEPK